MTPNVPYTEKISQDTASANFSKMLQNQQKLESALTIQTLTISLPLLINAVKSLLLQSAEIPRTFAYGTIDQSYQVRTLMSVLITANTTWLELLLMHVKPSRMLMTATLMKVECVITIMLQLNQVPTWKYAPIDSNSLLRDRSSKDAKQLKLLRNAVPKVSTASGMNA